VGSGAQDGERERGADDCVEDSERVAACGRWDPAANQYRGGVVNSSVDCSPGAVTRDNPRPDQPRLPGMASQWERRSAITRI
jgi:hypothetical protein